MLEVAKRTKDLNERVMELEDVRKAMTNLLEDFEEEQKVLAEAKAKDEAILASIGDGLVVVDKEGKILMVNKAFEELVGWKMKEVVGEFFIEKVSREDEAGNVSSFKDRLLIRILAGEPTTTTTTWYYVRKDGTRFPVSSIIAPIITGDKIVGAVEVFRDITKETEIDRVKTEFISIASHQLRTPVSGLNWLIEALQFTSQNLNPKQKTYVKDLAMLSKRLIGLVEDLLNISRIQLKTTLMTEKKPVDITALIEEFIKEIEPYASSKKHTIVFNKNIAGPLVLETNKKSLYNILQNLVSNAIEYSPKNTVVTINLEKTDDFIKTSVFNKGSTISKEEQAHLFGRFYRGESAKKMKAEGTGLGLYIIKTMIEEMGGEVGFESEEGKDTMFWFMIPLNKTDKNTRNLKMAR